MRDADTAPTTEARPATCQNCGTPLYGEHCYACGQPTRGLVRHFSSIVGDAVDTLFNVDGRLLRTLPALVLKPGFLSEEYFAGHRIRYVSPVRLFVFLCIATFFAAKLATPSFQMGGADRAGIGTGDDDAVETRAPAPAAGPAFELDVDSDTPNINLNGRPWDAEHNPVVIDALPETANTWLNAQIGHIPHNWKRIREDPDLLRNAFYSALPTALFVLVPVFAALLKLVFVMRRRLYMEHLVVALHGHAFICAMLLVLMGLSTVRGAVDDTHALAAPLAWAEWAATLWIPWGLWRLLRVVYPQRWYWALLTASTLAIAEIMLLSVVAVAALLASLVWL